MEIRQEVLKNKLNTLFVHSPGARAASVQIWFRAGSALEKKENEGIAHFLEHMFFKGTKKRPGAAIASEIESYGGEVNAFTSFDYTCYYINTPVTNLNQSTDILLDMVSNPQFLLNELLPERNVVHEEFRRSHDNPSQFAFKQIQNNFFTTGYSHQILGREKTILNFSQKQLNDFRNSYYNLENSMLVVSGDITKEKELKKIIEKYKLPSGKKSKFPKFKVKTKPTFEIHTKDVNQSLLTFTIQAPNIQDKDAAAEDLALSILGHGETSPLFKNLVHSAQIASSVSGSTMFFNDGGCHFMRASCPTENLNKLYKEFIKLFKTLLRDGLTEADVEKIKTQYLSSKVYEKESLESYAFSKGHCFAQEENIDSDDIFINKIKDVTHAEVNEALRKIFTQPIHISLQMPGKERSKKTDTSFEKFHKDFNSFKLPKTKASSTKYKESKFDPQVKIVDIKKGIKLIYRQNKLTPTFVMHTYLKGGLTNETNANNGIHNLLAALVRKGYSKIPFEDIKLDLESKSASLGGFAGKNAYGITMHGQTAHLDELMDHYFGALLKPDFSSKWLDYEKELVMRQLQNQLVDPVRNCFFSFNQIIFKDHPYSLNALGSEKSLKKITSSKIKKLHNDYLENSEMVFTYCGDLELEKVKALINDRISSISEKKVSKVIPKKVIQMKGQKIHMTMEREQTQIFIGRSGFKIGNINDVYLKMLNAHLSGQSSDLFVEVRDKQGLCYAVQPVHFTALEAGYWGIYIGAGHEKKDAAIDAIKNVLHDLQTKGISKKDFEKIKKMINGQEALNLQTNDDFANVYSVPELHGYGVDHYYKTNRQIQDAKHAEFNKFLANFLKTNWNVISVGRS